MFWILQISQAEEQTPQAKEQQKRMGKLFTNRAKARRRLLALARLERRKGLQAHKTEIAPEAPSLMVGVAEKGELALKGVGFALQQIPYIGLILVIPVRIVNAMLKAGRITLDWTVRRGLRSAEETHFGQELKFKQAAGQKVAPTRLHADGLFGKIRKILEEPIKLFGYPILTSQMSFLVRLVFFSTLIVSFVIMVGVTIHFMQLSTLERAVLIIKLTS